MKPWGRGLGARSHPSFRSPGRRFSALGHSLAPEIGRKRRARLVVVCPLPTTASGTPLEAFRHENTSSRKGYEQFSGRR